MQRWVEIYNADDVEALREFYADDVVTGNDVTGTDARGKEAVLAGSAARMTVTEGLRVEPLYSYEAGDLAYQAGRWMIHAPDGWLTGAHVFIFQRGADGQWRLQSTYYVHDPEPRLEEFASEGE